MEELGTFGQKAGTMYKIRSASGQELAYNSLEEFSAAVRRGEIRPEDEIFHSRAGRWLDVKSHPHYRMAIAHGGGASAAGPVAVSAPARPAPAPAQPPHPGQTTVRPQLQSTPSAAPAAPAAPARPVKSRELTFLDLGPEAKPGAQRNATIIQAQRAPAKAPPKPEPKPTDDFLVMDGGIESPARTSEGVRIIQDEADLLLGNRAPETAPTPEKPASPARPLAMQPLEPVKSEVPVLEPPKPAAAPAPVAEPKASPAPTPKPPVQATTVRPVPPVEAHKPLALEPKAAPPEPMLPANPVTPAKPIEAVKPLPKPVTTSAERPALVPKPKAETVVPPSAEPVAAAPAPAKPPEPAPKPEPVVEAKSAPLTLEPLAAQLSAPAPKARAASESGFTPKAHAPSVSVIPSGPVASAPIQPSAGRSRLPAVGAGVVAVLIAGALFAWRPWEGAASAAAAPASAGLSSAAATLPSTPSLPASAPSFGAASAAASPDQPGRGAATTRPATDSAVTAEEEIIAARPAFKANVDLSATPIDVGDAAGGSTGAAISPSTLARRLEAAERQAQQELAARLGAAGFRDVLTPSRLGSAQGVSTAATSWSSGADAIRQYRARIARIENAYQDSLLISQRAERWPASELRAWATRQSLAEPGETSQLGDLMVSQVSEALDLLAATQGQYEIRGGVISFRAPSTATRYTGIRTWVEQRMTNWAAIPESARPHTVEVLLRALGDGLPAIR